MKLTTGLQSDKLQLTLKDIWALMQGKTLKGESLSVTFKWRI
jgi:hypothetical protein